MTLRTPRPLCSIALFAAAASTTGCQLLFSFDGYAGNGDAATTDGGRADAPSHHDASPDAHRDGAHAMDARHDVHAVADVGTDVHEAGKDACTGAACSPCDGGLCTPVTIAEASKFAPSAIALDDTSVYWTELYGDGLWAVMKDGTLHRALTSSALYLTSIVIGDAAAYFGSTSGFVGSCPTAGCPAGGYDVLINSAGGDIQGVAVAGRRLFGIDEQSGTGHPIVLRGSVDGGSFLTTPSTPLTARLTGIAAIDAGVFWANINGIYSCPLAGCDAGTLVSSSTAAIAISVDASGVYWLTGNGYLFSCSASQVASGGCASPTPLNAQAIVAPAGMAMDGTSLYVSTKGTSGDGGVSNGDGTIGACVKTGCESVTPLASHEYAPGPIATDGVAVYWADTASSPSDGGAVFLIRKVLTP